MARARGTGLFLRDRRADLRPADVGLPGGPAAPHARLRRKEVARLAYISVEYYIRIEQARGPRPSARILHALAAALRLTPAERTHPFRLAGMSPAPPPRPPRQVRPHVANLLRRLPEAAAVVTDASYDVISFNPLAEAILGDLSEEAEPGPAPHPGTGWRRSSGGEDFSHIAVARLRGAAARYPGTAAGPPAGRAAGRQRGVRAALGRQPCPDSLPP